MASPEESSGVDRRGLLKGLAALTLVGLVGKSTPAEAAKKVLGKEILGYDPDNPVIRENNQIVSYYGITRKAVLEKLHPDHPHGDDPYKDFKAKSGGSCCSEKDCRQALVRQIGTKEKPEYAAGININGSAVFASSTENTAVFETENVDEGSGLQGDHACIAGTIIICLFIASRT